MDITRLRDFVVDVTGIVSQYADEARVMDRVEPALKALVEHDDWLPDAFAAPDERRYRQYLLYCDPLQRFSVVSFVWAPGQQTPVHDHTVWGLIGMLRGAELSTRFEVDPTAGCLRQMETTRLEAGEVDRVSPCIGDIHQVCNACDDRASISIHVYGGNIGTIRRHAFNVLTGATHHFVSGFSAPVVPNLWG